MKCTAPIILAIFAVSVAYGGINFGMTGAAKEQVRRVEKKVEEKENAKADAKLKALLPTVMITSPAGGTVVRGVAVISASASGVAAISKVQFYDGSTLIAEDNTAPYSVNWNTPEVEDVVSHSLTAKAIDASGFTGTSDVLSLTVDNIGIPVPQNGTQGAPFYMAGPVPPVVALKSGGRFFQVRNTFSDSPCRISVVQYATDLNEVCLVTAVLPNTAFNNQDPSQWFPADRLDCP